jgi:hypothetical protein
MSNATEVSPNQGFRVLATDLKRIDKNGVRASFTCYFPDLDLRIRECLWGARTGGQEWVALPSRSCTSDDGETRYTKLASFGSARTDRRFQEVALAAVRELDKRTA